MRSSWNIARRVESACVDISPSSNTDVLVDICDEKISDKHSCRRVTALCWVHVFVDKLSSDSYSAGASGGQRAWPPQENPPGWGCGQGFPNVSLAMCPPKTLFAPQPELLDSGAGTGYL